MQKVMKEAARHIWRAKTGSGGVDVRVYRVFRVASQQFVWRILQLRDIPARAGAQVGEWWRYRHEPAMDVGVGRPRQGDSLVRFGIGHVVEVQGAAVLVRRAEVASTLRMAWLRGDLVLVETGALVEKLCVQPSAVVGAAGFYCGVVLARVRLAAAEADDEAGEESLSDSSDSTYVPT